MKQIKDIHEVLLQYWGYSFFRPLQEEIIVSVLNGNDTLALLPTGGGKSICFQVPTLASEGLCLVVTPLISLMKDQVENLKKRKIKADAIYSGMSESMQLDAINNAIYNDTKFLYVSPERLKTNLILLNIDKLNISLIAVDEAHCISQWGYDFRPSYLEIVEIRKLLPEVNIIALTATATKDVVEDIQEKLAFKKNCLFKKSFERKNLSYLVYKEENKLGRLLRICKNVKGSGIVYANTRKSTLEISQFLNNNGVIADYYHAGIDSKDRDLIQNKWKEDKTQVIVATNAFGMGIDKPDVRFVVHIDMPRNIESYFQEAGRAGRDEQPAFAIMLYNDVDIALLEENYKKSYPNINTVKNVYTKICDHFKVPLGYGYGNTFDFDLFSVSKQLNISSMVLYSALKIIEKQGLLLMDEDTTLYSKMMFKIDRKELCIFQEQQPKFDSLIVAILRNYGGAFSEYININEYHIADILNCNVEKVKDYLLVLGQQDVIDYIPVPTKPQLILASNRVYESEVLADKKMYLQRKNIAEKKLKYIISYAEDVSVCRCKMLLMYFNEETNIFCGNCDYCRKRKKLFMDDADLKNLIGTLKDSMKDTIMSIEEIYFLVPDVDQAKTIAQIRWLIDNKIILKKDENKYTWGRRY